jgi:hypothetical protein
MTQKACWTIGLIVLLGGIHLATLRPGQEWGDDFSLYVAHARNISEGRAYADTGYIYNPRNPILSPRTYPPVFPLLLVPVYCLCGMDLAAMKVFLVLLFTALLGVLFLVYRKRLPLAFSLVCLALFALNPYVWQHKDRLLSEIPFMLFAYLALLLAERGQAAEASKIRLFWGVLAGLSVYLAFGTRTVGLVLVPSIIGWELWRRRRLGLTSLAIAAVFTATAIGQKMLLAFDGSYMDQVNFSFLGLAGNGLTLAKGIGLLVNNGYGRYPCVLLYVILLSLAAAGYGARLYNGATVYEFFMAFYCLLLVLWTPFDTAVFRYLMPILPLWLLYVSEGLCLLGSTSYRRAASIAAPALALAILISYANWFRLMEAGPIRYGVNAPEAVALFDWVKQRTDSRAVFLFQRPRALALYTGRHALAHHPEDDPQSLSRTLEKHGVTHLVVCYSSPFAVFQKSGRLVESLISEEPASFDKVYENPAFRVYRLRQGQLASR